MLKRIFLSLHFVLLTLALFAQNGKLVSKEYHVAVNGSNNNNFWRYTLLQQYFLERTDLSPYDKSLLPVQMEGNVYLTDAKPSKHEQQPVLRPDYNPSLELEEKNGEWYLTVNLEKAWSEEIKPKLITGKLLGTAVIPEQQFEDINSNPVLFNTDYLGIKRNTKNPCAGPFEIKKNRKQRIKVRMD